MAKMYGRERGAMDGKISVKYLQTYIKQKDYHPELLKDYFLKLSEEVGETVPCGSKKPQSAE